MRSGVSLSDETTRQVDRTFHAKAFGNIAQLRASRGKETAQQPTVAELRHPVLPALSASTQPREDPGQLGADRNLAVAKGNRISRKGAKAQGKIRARKFGIDFDSYRSTA
jgi:hypothetical protein